MKYIDAEKLRKLLANRYEKITVPILTDEGGLESFYRRSEIHSILKIVDSLQQEQQKEDLEKEIEEYRMVNEWSESIPLNLFKVIVRYFYGLGQLNSK